MRYSELAGDSRGLQRLLGNTFFLGVRMEWTVRGFVGLWHEAQVWKGCGSQTYMTQFRTHKRTMIADDDGGGDDAGGNELMIMLDLILILTTSPLRYSAVKHMGSAEF